MIYNFPMGTIIKFRYTKPNASFGYNNIKTILVLTSNYANNMHGLDVRGLTPVEQELFQYLFEAAQVKQQTGNPIQNQLIQKQKELQMVQQHKQELLQKKNSVVVTPDPNQTNKTFGTSTFRRTPIISTIFNMVSKFMVGKNQMSPQQIEQDLKASDQRILQTQQEIQRFQSIIGMYQQFDQINAVPKDPYSFYHGFIKPHFGHRIPSFYRKFNVNFVQNARIVRGVYSKGWIYQND